MKREDQKWINEGRLLVINLEVFRGIMRAQEDHKIKEDDRMILRYDGNSIVVLFDDFIIFEEVNLCDTPTMEKHCQELFNNAY